MKACWLFLHRCSGVWGQVSFDRILNANKEPQNWLTYSGTVLSQRHSLLTQITPANVKNLELQWVFQARSLEKFEATPLVVDGIMYTVQAPERRGRDGCRHRPRLLDLRVCASPEARSCCGRVNRGLAILGDTLVHGHHRWPSARARREKRQADLERRRCRSRSRLFADACAAGRERQSHRRAWPAASSAFAGFSRPTMPRPAKKPGGSTRSPARASPAMRHGRAIPGSTAALPSGLPAPTIRS